jgi:Ca-activated chloride channel family protein
MIPGSCSSRRGFFPLSKRICRALPLFILIGALAWLDPYRDAVSKGNERFHEKRYEEARKHYKDARQYAPSENERWKLRFNEGDAEYMQGEYEDAITRFNEALRTGDPAVQKKALFNLGNTYMRMGRYRDAIDSYISALKIDPRYEPAKKNLEYLLKMEEQKQKETRDGKDGEKRKGNRKEDGKRGEQKRDAERRGDQRSDTGMREQKGGKMSREQIRNILESMKHKPVRRQQGGRDGRRALEKDW